MSRCEFPACVLTLPGVPQLMIRQFVGCDHQGKGLGGATRALSLVSVGGTRDPCSTSHPPYTTSAPNCCRSPPKPINSMASTRNAYELLLGGDDQPFKPAGGKKKQKKKKQGAGEGAGSEPAVQARVPVAVGEDDGEFQPVPQHHVIKSRAAPEVRRAESDKELTTARASDACAALEKEAAAAAGGSARAALAAKWAEKVSRWGVPPVACAVLCLPQFPILLAVLVVRSLSQRQKERCRGCRHCWRPAAPGTRTETSSWTSSRWAAGLEDLLSCFVKVLGV